MEQEAMNFGKELAALASATVPVLRVRYAELFGEPTRSGNKAWLIKRIAWRLQALAEGDLSERARVRAAELANDADLRLSPPNSQTVVVRPTLLRATGHADRRLPPAGTVLTRAYQGRTLYVTVLADGFEHEGEMFKTLSAVAKKITGQHLNGYHFFRLRDGSPR